MVTRLQINNMPKACPYIVNVRQTPNRYMKRKPHGFFAVAMLAAVALGPSSFATPTDDDFDSFMSGAMSDFDSFLDQANRDFSNFMREPWKEFEGQKPVENIERPKPVVQPTVNAVPEMPEQLAPVAEPAQKPQMPARKGPVIVVRRGGEPSQADKPSPQQPKAETPKAKPQQPKTESTPQTMAPQPAKTPEAPVQPVKPQRQKPQPVEPDPDGGLAVQFGGVTYHVSDAMSGAVPRLSRLDENGISDVYEGLFRTDWQPLVKDLKKLRKNGLNSDWALFLFVKDVAEKLASGNESKVLRQFLLNQLGYKARVAIVPAERRLALYVPADCQLYGAVFVDVGSVRYYDTDARAPYSFLMCEKEAPAAKNRMAMRLEALPRLGGKTVVSTHTGKGISAALTVKASVPEALAEFYNRIPQCDFGVYSCSPVNAAFADNVLGALRPAIAGLDKTSAAALLLDYVQSAFDYATDGQQFGYEKPFFVEELFVYPKCDCEDRSVFYRYLVSELLGLDVVLLEYPNHLATAVKFDTDVKGDYVMAAGQKYTVCDPTYIGAGIGMAMPTFKGVKPKVIKL